MHLNEDREPNLRTTLNVVGAVNCEAGEFEEGGSAYATGRNDSIGSTTTVPRLQGEASPESATKCGRLLHRNAVQLRRPYSRGSHYFETLAAAEAALPDYLEDSRSPESATTPDLKVDPRRAKCTACKQHMLGADGCTVCSCCCSRTAQGSSDANTKAAGILARVGALTAEPRSATITIPAAT